jgi:hypothetical protein
MGTSETEKSLKTRGCSVVARSRPPRTAVCVLRVEARGDAGVLITVTTTPDVAVTSPGRTQTVARVDEALSLVASFLHGYDHDDVRDNGVS